MVRIHDALGSVGMRCTLWRVKSNGKEKLLDSEVNLQVSMPAVQGWAGLKDALAAGAKLFCHSQRFRGDLSIADRCATRLVAAG
jgi:hypothetical protein